MTSWVASRRVTYPKEHQVEASDVFYDQALEVTYQHFHGAPLIPQVAQLMCEETAQGSERQEVKVLGAGHGDWLSQGAKIVCSNEKNSVAALPGRRWNIKPIDFQ